MSNELARRAVESLLRAGAAVPTVVQVTRVYDHDITRVEILAGTQRRVCLVLNPDQYVRVGNSIWAIPMQDGSGRYAMLGFADAGSGAQGDWFNTTSPDITLPTGPIPGTRLPLRTEPDLWTEVADTSGPLQGGGPDATGGRELYIRPKPGDTPGQPNRVVAGPHDGTFIPSYGPLISNGNRIRITKDVGPLGISYGWRTNGEPMYDDFNQLIGYFMAGAGIGFRWWNGSPFRVISGFYDPGASDKTSLDFLYPLDSIFVTGGFTIGISYEYPHKNEDGDIIYARGVSGITDRFFTLGYRNGKPVVGLSRFLIQGYPPFDPNNMDSPDSSWFNVPEAIRKLEHRIFDPDTGQLIGVTVLQRNKAVISYDLVGSTNSMLTINGKQYPLNGRLYGGQDINGLHWWGGDFRGDITGAVSIGRKTYSLRAVRQPQFQGHKGEIAWHRQGFFPDGSRFADPGQDLLPTGLYLFTGLNQVVYFRPTNFLYNSDEAFQDLGNVTDPGVTGAIFPDHSQLGKLGPPADDHLQYHNDARALAWLQTRSSADLPDAPNKRYLSDAQVTALTTVTTPGTAPVPTPPDPTTPAGRGLVLTTDPVTGAPTWVRQSTVSVPTREDLSTQINGVRTSFATGTVYVAGSLRVVLNGLSLRSGVDFAEKVDQTGFSLDTVTPQPTDELTVEYRTL